MTGLLRIWESLGWAEPVVEALGWTLVHFLWQGAAVAGLLALVLLAMRRAEPRHRYRLGVLALLVMAHFPVGTFCWTYQSDTPRKAGSRQSASRSELVRPSPIMAIPEPIRPSGTPGDLTPPFVDARDSSQPSFTAETTLGEGVVSSLGRVRSAIPALVVCWLVGVVLLSLRLCTGWVLAEQLRRYGTRPVSSILEEQLRVVARDMGINRRVLLLESTRVDVPSLIGFLRPVILLPASGLSGLTPWQLDALLAHELAHVRRHDYLVNLLQSGIEILLFYHPAVWWVSHVIRAEREACCDAMAVEACGHRTQYIQALVVLEKFRRAPAQLAIEATGGPLLQRVRRLLGRPAQPAEGAAGWMLSAFAIGLVSIVLISQTSHAEPQQRPAINDQPNSDQDDWGPPAMGLQARLVPLSPRVDDEAVQWTERAESFANADELTLGVELKNVGQEPVSVLGVRYGENFPTAVGRLATESFAPHLFRLEFHDAASGQPVSRPGRFYLNSMHQVSGASVHELAPGQSLPLVLRPARFQAPMHHELPPGRYRVRAVYTGPNEKALETIRRHWPDKAQGRAWSGEVVSNEVVFTVAEDPATAEKAPLVWGDPRDGLRAAVTLRPRGGAVADSRRPVPLNTPLDAIAHIQNVSDRPIALVSETWRQDDRADVIHESGYVQQLTGTWYSGMPTMVRWILQPGEVAELSCAGIALAAGDEDFQRFEHPVGRKLVVDPGQYQVRYTLRLGSIQSRNAEGEVVVPGSDDWTGELVTGAVPLVVRERTPEDDIHDKTGHFPGRVRLVGPDGDVVRGSLQTIAVRAANQREDLTTIELPDGSREVPDCPPLPLTITVRAAGFEHAVFHNIELTPNETRELKLVPAEPTRLRLVSSIDGNPVAAAVVRYFNKRSERTSVGPFPTHGLEGPVWATSDADGTVVLDSLQKVDPYYEHLGDAIYSFYIESPDPGLVSRFLGKVKAGMDLGDVPMSPPIEVRGEIRGTADELARFAADWDQPFETTNAAPYAVSQRLETQREADRLTFHLTGLRPGKLRIIACFVPRPHSTSYVHGRREPKESDVLIEVELEDSLDSLVVTPEGRLRADGAGE